MRLRPGVTARSVIDSLDGLIRDAGNIAHADGGSDSLTLQNRYLIWTETAERSLRHSFALPEVWESLDYEQAPGDSCAGREHG
jgi:hypothetical protein